MLSSLTYAMFLPTVDAGILDHVLDFFTALSVG